MPQFLDDRVKLILKNCIEESNCFIIVATGRAGTDYLQSCYEQHQQIASTCEKSANYIRFIEKYKKSILKFSTSLFSTLAVEQLILSFAPYLNIHEDWRITNESKYKQADPKIFVECLSYLLDLKPYPERNNYFIAKCMILSFAFSQGKDISKIKCILFHIHSLKIISSYEKYFTAKDLIIVCSRSIFKLMSSGVNHWQQHFENQQEYINLADINRYKRVYKRFAFDYLLIKDKIKNKKVKIRLTILEKLGDLDYINKINKLVGIHLFDDYPKSTVLGLPRRPDRITPREKVNSQSIGTFNASLINQGSALEQIGIIETLLLTVTHVNRIKTYEIDLDSKFQKIILNYSKSKRIFLFISLLLIPTKSEINYYFNFIPNMLSICKSKKLSSNRQKLHKLLYLFDKGLKYFYEYTSIRFSRVKAFNDDLKERDLIKEL